MNNEQLENSLRDEIDNYFRTTFAQIQDDIANLQGIVDAEIKKHKDHVEEKFTELHTQTGQKAVLESSFMRVVTEHLRVAREEGEQSAAKEFAAQPLVTAPATVQSPADFTVIRDAVHEISSQTSQSEILKSLVNQASNFAVRGAFFIVKGDKLVGWRKFGKELEGADDSMKGVNLPLASGALPAKAIQNSTTQFGTDEITGEDAELAEKLDFSPAHQSATMPLVVRGRGVAVLYADSGAGNSPVQVEALESLMRVASLTVELMASAKNVGIRQATVASPPQAEVPVTNVPESEFSSAPNYAPEQNYAVETASEPVTRDEAPEVAQTEPVAPFSRDFHNAPLSREMFEPTSANKPQDESPTKSDDNSATEDDYKPATEPSYESAVENDYEPVATGAKDFGTEASSFSFSPPNPYREAVEREAVEREESAVATMEEVQPATAEFSDRVETTTTSRDFQEFEVNSFTPSSYEAPAVREEVAPIETPVAVAVPPVEATPAPVTRRFGERNADLPIEVPEEERRVHNDARRFARLLVSEIKLYNEAKVKEGRQESDLYERLREAIDRSREMYDKRVSEGVAAKFDYFHYELVNTLAEGDEAKLGYGYRS